MLMILYSLKIHSLMVFPIFYREDAKARSIVFYFYIF
jgi:hypothetical protein